MTKSFHENLRQYAEVALSVGLNLQPDQGLFIRAPIEAAELVEEVKRVAGRLGCSHITEWQEDVHVRHNYLMGLSSDLGGEEQSWQAMNRAAESGDALLAIKTEHPGLMKDVDPKRLEEYQKSYSSGITSARKITQADRTNWLVICAASPGWAADIFPGEEPDVRLDLLWNSIFQASRVDHPDPVKSWREHNDLLQRRVRILNGLGLASLKLTSEGTDLTVGLVDGHIWKGGQTQTIDERKIPFHANIPTEEVYTMPHRGKVDGDVSATRPLVYKGVELEDFSFRFDGGRVVQIKAKKRDKQIIKDMINTDEGASRLGEVGLADETSPLARMGLIFKTTLLDENAATHLALGGSYPGTVRDGADISEAEYLSRGGNLSEIHEDFMVGSNTMNIDGETIENQKTPLMRNGTWVI